MSSLAYGDSRFEDDDSLLATRLASLEANPGNFGAEDIHTATSGELAYILPEHLKEAKVLGQGTSFRVTREVYHQPTTDTPTYSPYYVAVKRFLSLPSSRHNASRKLPYAGLLRELRVIMHPPLRSHGCIVKLLGYGWEQNPERGLEPYFVMEYTDHGNLVEYLKRCNIPLHERRELALDVASALEALHSCGIVHGDLKADNVLIYDNEDVDAQLKDFTVRPQLARISDFGAAIFAQDLSGNSEVTYLGTPGYLAPDLVGRPGTRKTSLPPKLDLFKSADVYSFGLLMWEILKNGAKYINITKLRESGEDLDDVLDQMCALECDALMESAISFCDGLTGDVSSIQAFRGTLALCLQDDPTRRASTEFVVSELAKGIRAARPRYLMSQTVSQPVSTSLETSNLPTNMNGLSYKVNGTFVKRIQVISHDNPLGIRLLADDEQPGTSAGLGSLPLIQPSKASAIEYGVLDIFKASKAGLIYWFSEPELTSGSQVLMTRSPPWTAQSRLMQRMLAVVTRDGDQSKKAHAHLQLSVMYHVGYGVKPNPFMALFHLKASNSASALHERLYTSVLGALEVLLELERSLDAGEDKETQREEPDFSPLRPKEPGLAAYTADEVLPVGELVDVSKLSLTEKPYDFGDAKPDMLALLTAACQTGDFNAAKEFAQRRIRLLHRPGQPSFLHWLIMFEAAEAKELLHLLLSKVDVLPATNTLEPKTDSFHYILGQDSGPPLYFPSLCLELCGTPLHWAVRTGHIGLVSLLLDYGADIDQRWRFEMQMRHDRIPLEYFRPSFTAIELAVLYHFADITSLLLDKGGRKVDRDLNWNHSCMHMIGMSVVPFSRFVVHGRRHLVAVQRTIEVLQQRGLRIDDVDSLGETPLSLAIHGTDIEPYILEELLRAEAAINGNSPQPRNGTMLIPCIEIGPARPLDTRRVEILIPQLDDLNALDDVSGRSALHWCAALGVASVCQVLLDTGRVDPNLLSASGLSPLMEAAFDGSVTVIDCLVQAGADLELRSSQPGQDVEEGLTALEIAVTSRRLEAAVKLIDLGAQVGAGDCSILHLAIAGASRRGSIARELLRDVPMLRSERILNRLGKDDWTPLHRAVAFGDRDSVEALLEAGADLGAISEHGTALNLVNSIITAAEQASKDTGLKYPEISIHGRNIGPVGKQETQQLIDIGRILSSWASET